MLRRCALCDLPAPSRRRDRSDRALTMNLDNQADGVAPVELWTNRGEVISDRKWSDTHVQSSGGGGYINSDSTGHVQGYIAAPSVSGKVVQRHTCWVRYVDGKEAERDISALDIPVRAGHQIAEVGGCVPGRDDKGVFLAFANLTTGSHGVFSGRLQNVVLASAPREAAPFKSRVPLLIFLFLFIAVSLFLGHALPREGTGMIIGISAVVAAVLTFPIAAISAIRERSKNRSARSERARLLAKLESDLAARIDAALAEARNQKQSPAESV